MMMMVGESVSPFCSTLSFEVKVSYRVSSVKNDGDGGEEPDSIRVEIRLGVEDERENGRTSNKK